MTPRDQDTLTRSPELVGIPTSELVEEKYPKLCLYYPKGSASMAKYYFHVNPLIIVAHPLFQLYKLYELYKLSTLHSLHVAYHFLFDKKA